MGWSNFIRPMQSRFRQQRAEKILKRFPQIKGSTVIDIGGSLAFWKTVEDILRPARVIVYNIDEGRMKMGLKPAYDWIELQFYDGTRIPQDDNAAEIVICNSVIEHVPPESRASLASEVMRVGRNFVAQIPSSGSPLELHFSLPFVRWLPRVIGRQVLRLSPLVLPSGANATKYFDETKLLSRTELEGYFPQARIEIE